MKLIKYCILFTALFFLFSCNKNNTKKSSYIELINNIDSTGKVLIADTIIYDVIIHKKNPEDTWQDESLRNFNHKEYINYIFEKIYQKKIIPVDYLTSKPISIKQIRKLEKSEDFKRKNISKIQFHERWYLDTLTQQIDKQIISVIFAYSIYNNESELRGYKAAFKINY